MYKKEFDTQKKTYNAYLFWGDEPYFTQKYTKKTADSITPKENRLQLYFDEYDFEAAKNYLSQASLFGDTNLLIIKHDKALPKKEIETLIQLCNKNPNSFLIYQLDSNEGKKLETLFGPKNSAVHVRFFKPSLHEAKNELLHYAKEQNINIDSYSIEHLLATLQNNLSLAIQELAKLSLIEGPIGSKEIDALVFPLNPLKLEHLYKSIIKKEPIEEQLQKILEEEQNEMKILLGFENFLQQLFLFYSYIRLHGKSDSKAILGYKLPKQIEEERVQLAIRIKKYPEIFLLLQECELLLKTKTNIDKEAILFSYLIKIQALF
ncbi:DNA polymerase III subunit delta [Nitratiruptor sp. SB155-2]|uniref:DNA polymerase III subunit delta n=1 Tax=Nitratiruptor sp. (strain SB155-2) TaxID=387092 RepID=UPI000158706D|nr:DNA polymerase III subunit delta [Nitratiruptor sp. SB155-2]BAF70272.1 conserved hypothetical protein [Nitratiruptor sp. SB155-2]